MTAHRNRQSSPSVSGRLSPSSSIIPLWQLPSSRWWCLLLNLVLILILCTIKQSHCFKSLRIQTRHDITKPRSSFLTTSKTCRTTETTKTIRSTATALYAASKSGAKLMSSPEDFESSVIQTSSTLPVMVFYTAPWCGPCRLVTPVVKDVMKFYKSEMEAVEVCTDDLPDVCAEAGVVSIPTIQMYFRGKLMDTIVGCVAKPVLSSAVEKVVEDAAADQKRKQKKPFRRNDDDSVNGDQQQ